MPVPRLKLHAVADQQPRRLVRGGMRLPAVGDEVDGDCNGVEECYVDADGDGYGNPDSAVTACDALSGYVTDDTDCDDADLNTFPGSAELDSTSDCMTDADGDGYGAPSGINPGTDCDDSDALTNPAKHWAFSSMDTSNPLAWRLLVNDHEHFQQSQQCFHAEVPCADQG